MRKPIIAGNWKMNMTQQEAKALIEALKPLVKSAEADVVVCVPYTALTAVAPLLESSNIRLGAQNVHWAEKGAFTGEISADMLKESGVEYAIVGHSERRQYFGETDETVNRRVKAALAASLTPIVCVGESLSQRESGETDALVTTQVNLALDGLTKEDMEKLVIAYEPIWAIGTGKTATKEQANETIAVVRAAVRGLFGEEAAEKVLIQYGGSMNASNAGELMAMDEIDGGLIGGASLKAAEFSKVVNFKGEEA